MKAYLILANGLVFAGKSVGASGTAVGEVVFTTGMVGFEETLTDPSYFGQLITQTYPLIGNYGFNGEDMEGAGIAARGYIVREACAVPSNFRCEESLDSFLKKHGTVGIEGVDTRRLTRIIRESGVMNGAVTTAFDPREAGPEREALLEKIRGYTIQNAVASVTAREKQVHNQGGAPRIALLDFGCKGNIVRCLTKRGAEVTVLPASTPPAEVLALAPDGLMLTNGPGDPEENTAVIANIKSLLDTGLPAFGICLGHQLTALAAGGKTEKLKYGHRGANQPVTEFSTGRTYITSQNHGYAVVSESLPEEVGRVSHVNANDGTCEGVQYTAWNCFTVQFHPEACGGPHDTEFLFDRFLAKVNQAKGGQ